MKRFNRAFALLAAAVMLLSLTACTPPSPERELAKAQEKLTQVRSFRYDMDMDIRMTVDDTSISVKTVCRADCVANPLILKMDINLDISEVGSVDYIIYAAQTEDGYTAYTKMYDDWIKEELGGLGELEQYDARSNMDAFLSGFTSVTEAGSEEVSGIKTTRYDCVVSGETIDEIIESSGAYTQLSLLGIGDEQAKEMLSGLGEVPYSIWIDAKRALPVRYELDMSGIMGSLMDKMLKDNSDFFPDISLDKMTISVTMSDFDEIGSIEIPDEANDAVDITESFPLFS